ncbi:MAG: hypothetical protein K2J80_03855 [Oscillospiraceae bacterium]|nr:hypothetical protein [Oscillospiraceae bacterium]
MAASCPPELRFHTAHILLAAAMTIHSIIDTMNTGGSIVLDFIGVIFDYSVPVVLINVAWVVVYMNMKERLEEKG